MTMAFKEVGARVILTAEVAADQDKLAMVWRYIIDSVEQSLTREKSQLAGLPSITSGPCENTDHDEHGPGCSYWEFRIPTKDRPE